MDTQKYSETSVFVRGVGRECTVEELNEAFSRFGNTLPTSKALGMKRIGFVDFERADAASKALAAKTATVGGIEVQIEKRVMVIPTVHVSPIAKGTNPDTLRDVFSTLIGTPLSIRLRSKGSDDGEMYAFVQFGTEAEVETALANSGLLLSGTPLRIERVRRNLPPRPLGARPPRQAPRADGAPAAAAAKPARAPKPAGAAGSAAANGEAAQPRPKRAPREKKEEGDAPAAAAAAAAAPREPRPPREPRKQQPGVYVKSLPEGSTEDEVRAAFAPFGAVSKVDMRTLDTIKAFVTFGSAAATEAACAASRDGKLGALKATPARNRPEVAHIVGFDAPPTEQELIQKLAPFGAVSETKVVPVRSYCIVSFETPEAAEAALKANVTLKGFKLDVEPSVRRSSPAARPRPPRPVS